MNAPALLVGPYGPAYADGFKAGKRNARLQTNPASPGSRARFCWLAGWHSGFGDAQLRRKPDDYKQTVDRCRRLELIYLEKAEQSRPAQTQENGHHG